MVILQELEVSTEYKQALEMRSESAVTRKESMEMGTASKDQVETQAQLQSISSVTGKYNKFQGPQRNTEI